MRLPLLDLPESLNYIGLFLTLDCNLNCSYCINDPRQEGQRSTVFPIHAADQRSMSPDLWAKALARIPYSPELPITLQGGEPMLYWKSQGLGLLLEQVPHYFDLLTNFALQPAQFARSLRGQQAKLQREAPYPSIRVSYHAEEMDRAWKGRGFQELVDRCAALDQFGFRVSPEKAESDVGIYMVAHPENHVTAEMERLYQGRVPFETKEFLGVHDNRLYGHYLYPFSTDLISRGVALKTLECECRTTELLLDPLGFVWGCHFFLYQSWVEGGPKAQFSVLAENEFRFAEKAKDLFGAGTFAPIGHILDPEFTMAALNIYRRCNQYGRCIGCDTKIKNDRFQSYYDRGVAHTSVQMRNIRMPAHLLRQIPDPESLPPFLHPECSPQ